MIHEKCPFYKEAVIWYFECMLRYANRSILYGSSETLPRTRTYDTNRKVSDYGKFGPVLKSTMDMVISKAASSTALGHFGTGEANWTLFEKVYCMAQCTPDISEVGCKNCLISSLSRMSSCCNFSITVMLFTPSCQLRYDTDQKFYLDTPNNVLNTNSNVHPGKGDAAESLRESELVETVEYDFVSLKVATKDFCNDYKLGEGGFGAVYMGTLNNGEVIAIKRLSANSGQGAKEFMTEARLVAKLQHKNLVKLLGFCSEGDEKLLVYEFLPNSSVDRFLFDPRKRATLDWETRCKIITGIARGLQYLHEDSRLTIVHRDLKPSNILLDKDMNPKIADFGTAKLFGVEQTYGNTSRIVGTQGYMAPEYMLVGEYSAKSDIYSFGILILEVVSGQKNRVVYQSPHMEDISLLAWKMWSEGRTYDLTDPTICDTAPRREVARCIQIGLLCVQQNPEQRPTMAAVVLMLTGLIALPLPLKPLTSLHYNYSNTPSLNDDSLPTKAGQSNSKSVTRSSDVEHDLYTR
ncbi:unnamed protein product [Amaranthus hypochondriacus]